MNFAFPARAAPHHQSKNSHVTGSDRERHSPGPILRTDPPAPSGRAKQHESRAARSPGSPLRKSRDESHGEHLNVRRNLFLEARSLAGRPPFRSTPTKQIRLHGQTGSVQNLPFPAFWPCKTQNAGYVLVSTTFSSVIRICQRLGVQDPGGQEAVNNLFFGKKDLPGEGNVGLAAGRNALGRSLQPRN